MPGRGAFRPSAPPYERSLNHPESMARLIASHRLSQLIASHRLSQPLTRLN
jgi:hypothetical protein